MKKIAQIWPTTQNAQKQTTQNKGTVMRHVLQCTRAATHTHIRTRCTYAYTGHIRPLHTHLYARAYKGTARAYIRNAHTPIRIYENCTERYTGGGLIEKLHGPIYAMHRVLYGPGALGRFLGDLGRLEKKYLAF